MGAAWWSREPSVGCHGGHRYSATNYVNNADFFCLRRGGGGGIKNIGGRLSAIKRDLLRSFMEEEENHNWDLDFERRRSYSTGKRMTAGPTKLLLLLLLLLLLRGTAEEV